MDDVVNRFARELADSIAAAVSESAEVEACRERARAAGYEMKVNLEAVVGFVNRGQPQTDGTDAAFLKALKAALAKAGATFEIIAPKVGGAKASDGSWIEADQMIDGAPSVLYDAVALLPAESAMDDLLQEHTARDFVADAFAHCKFIGHVEAAAPLFAKAGIVEADIDEGFILLARPKDAAGFIEKLGRLRVWAREPSVKMK